MRKLVFVSVTSLFTIASLHAQSNTLDARLVARTGNVEVQRDNAWFEIAPGQALNPGDRVRTGGRSSAAVEFDGGKVVTLNESSEIQLRPSNSSPLVQLNSGSMKVFAPTDIQVGAKDMVLQSAELPLDMELGYQADQLNLTVFNGSVRNGSMTIRGTQDATTRTYTAGGRLHRNPASIGYPGIYIYPYFVYGNPDPNSGAITPPVVNNPTNPGYRPTQIVPPMTDPIRPPVKRP